MLGKDLLDNTNLSLLYWVEFQGKNINEYDFTLGMILVMHASPEFLSDNVSVTK